MKHLNKIIFIKAANIDYQEILLNGNVHLTGDQGVGKTTVLRAVLFFYNADTQRLGIPKVANKSDFADYYFEFPNSHIVYEVVTGEGRYLIWLYKEHNKLCYRFIDSEYKKDFFLSETPKGILPLKPNKVQENILTQTRHSRKVQKFSEYRNIIYGATSQVNGLSRSFKQYSIIESPAYQNIPKTISNIYLNSNLKSDAIKTTIINSISVDDFAINEGKGYKVDLNVLRTQLNDFKQDYNDISVYEKIKKRANIIIQNYDELIRREQERILAAKTLGVNYKTEQSNLKFLESDNLELSTKFTVCKNSIIELQKQFGKTKTEYDKKIAIEQKNIDDAKEKISHYGTVKKEDLIGIESILEFVSKEDLFSLEYERLKKEQKILTSQVQTVEEKYQNILLQLENNHKASVNTVNEKKSTLKSDSARQQSKVIEQYANFIEDIRKLNEQQKDEEIEKQISLKDTGVNLEKQRNKIEATRFLENEIEQEYKYLKDYKELKTEKSNKIKLDREEIEKLKNKGNHKKEVLDIKFENLRKELDRERIENQTKIDQNKEKLTSFKDSFHEYLNKNYPNWQNTIGKVCDEDVLLSPNLKPKIEKINQSFFGVNIDLSELDLKVKTITDYQKENREFYKILENIKTRFRNEQNELDLQKQKISSRYSQKLKKLNQDILNTKAFVSQTEIKISQVEVNILKLKKEAERKKIEELAKIEPLIKDVSEKLGKSKQIYNELKVKQTKQVEQKQIEQKAEINKIKNHFKTLISNLDNQIKSLNRELAGKCQNIQDQRIKELEGKVDTHKLKELEGNISIFKQKLESIKKLLPFVAVYNEDKSKLIDRLPQFKASFNNLDSALNQIVNNHNNEIEVLESEKKEIEFKVNKVKEDINEREKQIDDFNEFKNSPFYKEVEYFIIQEKGIVSGENLTFLIKKIKNLQFDISESFKTLKSVINRFVSPLRDGNIFNFQKTFKEEIEYRSFANDLKDFITENKIDDYKKYIKKNHSDLINLIVKHIEQLSSKKKEIDEIISKMNKDFERHNFVGVVQKVELKADPSENKVFQTFEEIRKFHSENPFGFGEQNLFTGLKLEENNESAFILLVALISNLTLEQNKIEISLEDTFELKFKVVENNKDTGWQTKLADIGSNGTDVLVKAMLYIMLLNVLKEKASKKQKDFKLHCIMDEINIIHPKNIGSLIDFANDRGIWMINGSPIETNAMAYKYVYDFEKTTDSITHANRLIAQN